MNPLDRKTNCPCNGCPGRVVTDLYNCHTDCERYNAWAIVQLAEKSMIDRERFAKTYRHENYVKVLAKKHK